MLNEVSENFLADLGGNAFPGPVVGALVSRWQLRAGIRSDVCHLPHLLCLPAWHVQVRIYRLLSGSRVPDEVGMILLIL